MKDLNLDYLESFRVVIESGSFSAAAERLQLTQPAVSLQVRQLERSLGATLIERVGRRARPTAAGAALLTHAEQISAAVTSAVDAVAQQTAGTAGRVRLGTGATACIFLLPPILKELRAALPGLEITVTTGNTPEIAKAVEDNTIDIGLVTLPVSGRSFEITPVLNDEFVLIAPPDMPLPARITPAVLATRPVVLFEPGGNTRRTADEWLARGGVALKPLMSLGSVEAIKEMVRAGLGCAILPGMAVSTTGKQRDLAVRSLSPKLYRRLAVVIRRDKRLDRGLRQTLSALKAIPADGR
ncbi:LysR family transcriptional regulator [Bradyrhizobium sp. ISRA443]|uniref:LysR family transcriptional regulator n=1 Tax=unclassified Bradyrhizobium TaxID=2631580 RepID=UPI0024788CEB|nr:MULTISPECIES: LysR family transcriptional regulator [unclassified Bradyrhizobium]WGR92447.1 LysR family transcriptional regulator [Bradyrhizobium sp. ISRA435]WGR96818.1 LysR family transcriptional regulator [Bradyrhizobium sp. ISRA436]WGS03706.1 LysR family transcriptional regulator [Bradyrhizobium sp. ISRA437]WGS10590.1 LysR family transcriptional regulator [Bradyrhizobium sp. ISRA443]